MKPTYLRKLDALLAEHVVGVQRGYWSNSQQKQIDCDWFEPYRVPDPASGHSETVYPIEWVKRYSVQPAFAWECVEIMRAKSYWIDWSARSESDYECRVGTRECKYLIIESGTTIAEASARAILCTLNIILPEDD